MNNKHVVITVVRTINISISKVFWFYFHRLIYFEIIWILIVYLLHTKKWDKIEREFPIPTFHIFLEFSHFTIFKYNSFESEVIDEEQWEKFSII